ncbi:hypothetical protein MODO_2539 [Myroides odoratimimus]|uniref:DUF6520 family protein n=1 Tax=Myroides odoratimimus TaxID=76832 RepID=UPI00072A323D|nr:DUF6520 family protein [Myroides odoratimimus]MDM1033734.1 hypothetical protein [Myroides odoratimimus]MDM1086201.1 hypothetical protein [Myroides odoratimimus]MEC4095380.1 DUF6520 family protein [Myroides odoratimimus]STZ48905.1 Uncharacterised protein [Myroides odoratimimus]GAQ14847.1 hypothetical protein MODO_2539 [Myroides odoratimimus]
MKKFLKSAGLPIGVFALAIGSAFATNAVKNALVLEPGYQKIDELGLECNDPKVMCSTEFDTQLCTWTVGSTTHTLYGEEFDSDLNQTVCTKTLYRITP